MTRTINPKRRTHVLRCSCVFAPLLLIHVCGGTILAQRAFGPENEVRVPEMAYVGSTSIIYSIRPVVAVRLDAGITVFAGRSSRSYTWDMQDLGRTGTLFETYYAKYLASGDLLLLTRSIEWENPSRNEYPHWIRTIRGTQARDSINVMTEGWKSFDDDDWRSHVLPSIVVCTDTVLVVLENEYLVGWSVGVRLDKATVRLHEVHPGSMTRREPPRTLFFSPVAPVYDHAAAAQLSDGSLVFAMRQSDTYISATHYQRTIRFQQSGVDSLTAAVLIDSVMADSCDLSDQIVAGDNGRFHILRTASRGTLLRASSFNSQGALIGERTVLSGLPGWDGSPARVRAEHIADYSLVRLSTGQFIIAWTALESGGDLNVYVAGFSSEFTPLATPKRISSVAMGKQKLPRLAIQQDTIWAVWYHEKAGGMYDLYLRKLTAADVAGVLRADSEPIMEAEPELQSFPNPFTDRVQLEYRSGESRDASTAHVRIIDVLGRALYSNESVPVTHGRARCLVSAAAYPPGVYIAEVSHGGQVTRTTIVRSSR